MVLGLAVAPNAPEVEGALLLADVGALLPLILADVGALLPLILALILPALKSQAAVGVRSNTAAAAAAVNRSIRNEKPLSLINENCIQLLARK